MESLIDRIYMGAMSGAVPTTVAATCVFGLSDHPLRVPTPAEALAWSRVEWISALVGAVVVAVLGNPRRAARKADRLEDA